MRDGKGAAPALQAAEGWPQLRRANSFRALAQIHGGYQNACWLSRACTESTPVGYFNPTPDRQLAACKTLAGEKGLRWEGLRLWPRYYIVRGNTSLVAGTRGNDQEQSGHGTRRGRLLRDGLDSLARAPLRLLPL